MFLKSYKKSYILAKKGIEEKIISMKLLRPYKFKKIDLDEDIFENENGELKVGYPNINGV